MKVLEKGPGWNLKIKCTGKGNGDGGCGSLLLIENGDVYLTANSFYDGSIDYYYTIYCPVCGAETDIPKKDIPSRIANQAKEEYKKNGERSRSYLRKIKELDSNCQ